VAAQMAMTTTATILRWTTRVLGILLLVTIATFVIGEGVPNPLHGSVAENLLTAAFLTMIVAQIAAWKWEGIGGLLIVASFALFVIVNQGVPINELFGLWLLTGLLYLVGWGISRTSSQSRSRPGLGPGSGV
jgi:hypothetical protein